jgi:hypothetical protein
MQLECDNALVRQGRQLEFSFLWFYHVVRKPDRGCIAKKRSGQGMQLHLDALDTAEPLLGTFPAGVERIDRHAIRIPALFTLSLPRRGHFWLQSWICVRFTQILPPSNPEFPHR